MTEMVERVASILRTGARLSMSTGEACLIRLSSFDEDNGGVHIGSAPTKRNDPSELVRVYVDVPDAIHGVLCNSLRAEIEPFIMGVGKVMTHKFQEGFIIALGERQSCLDDPGAYLLSP